MLLGQCRPEALKESCRWAFWLPPQTEQRPMGTLAGGGGRSGRGRFSRGAELDPEAPAFALPSAGDGERERGLDEPG